jgi:hypothetical protein
MLIRFFFLLCSLGSCASLFSQTSEVTGRIVDAATQETLPFVNVFLNSSTIATSTDQNGAFNLINVSHGVRELVVYATGYETIQAYISVNEDLIELGIIEMTKSISPSA